MEPAQGPAIDTLANLSAFADFMAGGGRVSITLDTYSHVLPGIQAAAAERLAAVLEGPETLAPEGGA